MLQCPCSILKNYQKIKITKYLWRGFRRTISIKILIAMWTEIIWYLSITGPKNHQNRPRDYRWRSILEIPLSWRPSWMPSWILKNAQRWIKFTCEILFVTQIILQVKPGCFNPLMSFFVVLWRLSLKSDTKMLQKWNITMIYDLYGSGCICIESRTQKNI